MQIRLLPSLLSVLALQAQAQMGDLQRCSSIADPVSRLACYDAAMPPTSVRPPTPAVPQAPRPSSSPAVATSALPSPPATKADTFGLPQDQKVAQEQAIESTTGPNFYGWGPNERIRLQNGQVWQVTDGTSGTLTASGTKVTVRKGLFGAYVMEFAGLNRSPKVRRVE